MHYINAVNTYILMSALLLYIAFTFNVYQNKANKLDLKILTITGKRGDYLVMSLKHLVEIFYTIRLNISSIRSHYFQRNDIYIRKQKIRLTPLLFLVFFGSFASWITRW